MKGSTWARIRPRRRYVGRFRELAHFRLQRFARERLGRSEFQIGARRLRGNRLNTEDSGGLHGKPELDELAAVETHSGVLVVKAVTGH